MIDPKELRIGNYVRSLKNNINLCFGGNLPFWEVTIDDMLHVLNNPKNYEPIPLTEEWLIKFGFKKTHRGNFEKDDLPHYIYRGIGLYYPGVSPEIKYVHQLQSIYYAITGKELIYNENHK